MLSPQTPCSHWVKKVEILVFSTYPENFFQKKNKKK
jgi:hypothetical protein